MRRATAVIISMIALCQTMITPAAADLSAVLNSYTITLLEREYHAESDTTTFRYDIEAGLLAPLVNKLQIVQPNCEDDLVFTSIDTDLNCNLLFDSVLDNHLLQCLNLAFPGSSEEVLLTVAGNVPQGEVEVILHPTLGQTLQATVAGIACPLPLDPPNCWSDSESLLQVDVGTTLSLPFQATHPDGNLLSVRYDSLPGSATCSHESGSTYEENNIVSINWTPTEEDVRAEPYDLNVEFFDTNAMVSLCQRKVRVLENQKPIIVGLNPYILTCEGLSTRVALDASASYDPEGLSLNYKWDTTCPNATFTDDDTQTGVLLLSGPGQGQAADCLLSLTISDGTHSVKKSVALQVSACDTNCSSAEKDQCGVCNGSNLCLDCSGTPFGTNIVDRCGVCGGTNDCLDCAGVKDGSSERDVCGVCNGDSTSCRSCNILDYSDLLKDLDGVAADQEKSGMARMATIVKSSTSKVKKKFKRTRKRSSKLRNENWSLAWGLALKDMRCNHSVGCQNKHHKSKLNSYMGNARKLKKNSLLIIRDRRLKLLNRLERRTMIKSIRGLFKQARKLAKLYPEATYYCEDQA